MALFVKKGWWMKYLRVIKKSLKALEFAVYGDSGGSRTRDFLDENQTS